jgi:aminoglycoside phosphotransferase (APT) family kinase protein
MSEPGTAKGIDAERLGPWFESHVEGAKTPLVFELITGGHSNLTFSVRDAAGHHYVLRRPPTGAVIATAHDMAREHRILAALAPTEVPVPPVLALCEDESVNDAPFYVMSYVEGVVLVDQLITAERFDARQRRHLGERVIEVLATLHEVDPNAVGLGDLGRREEYLERQLRRWQKQWEKTKTRELPVMEEAYACLLARRPEQVGATIVHGDYRLGNMLVGRDGEIAAILDWELCTLGDPLADVGYILNNWAEPGEGGPSIRGAAMSPTLAGGFPDRREFLERYEKLTGRDVTRIDYYRAFQYWRLAAIVEGVLSRYLKGVMADRPNTRIFSEQVEGLAKAALDLLNQLPD